MLLPIFLGSVGPMRFGRCQEASRLFRTEAEPSRDRTQLVLGRQAAFRSNAEARVSCTAHGGIPRPSIGYRDRCPRYAPSCSRRNPTGFPGP